MKILVIKITKITKIRIQIIKAYSLINQISKEIQIKEILIKLKSSLKNFKS